MIARLRQHIPELVISLTAFILLGIPLLQNQVLFWGTPALQFVGWRLHAWEIIQQGGFPWWNGLNGLGAPLAANYQSALFYPPGWILYPLAAGWGAGGIAWGFTLLNLLHLVWAGIGMAKILRKLGYGILSQSTAGLAFAFCGFLTARLGFFSMIWAGAWLPWLVLAVTPAGASQGVDSGRGQRVKDYLPSPGLIAVVWMMLLAGHAQVAWYSLLITAAWIPLVATRPCGGRGILRAWITFGIAGIIAAMAAAIQLVPTAEFLLASQRAGEYGYESAIAYSFWPWRLLTFFTPDIFGNPGEGTFWGFGAYWEDAVYVGLFPLLLALGTISLRRKPANANGGKAIELPIIRWAWILIAIGVVLALGSHTPVFPFLYRNIPTFDMFQAPTRFMLLAEFGLALLAGIGVRRWHPPSGRALYWTRLGTAGAGAVALGAGIGWVSLHGVEQTFIRAFALAGVLGLTFGLLTLFRPVSSKWKMVWTGVVITVIAGDLLIFAFPNAPLISATSYSDPTAPFISNLGTHRAYLPEHDEYLIKFKRFVRFDDFRPAEKWSNIWESGLPNTNLVVGYHSANNFDPLLPARFVRWQEAVDGAQAEAQLHMMGWMDVALTGRFSPFTPGGVEFSAGMDASYNHWFSCGEYVDSADEALRRVLVSLSASGNLVVDKAVLEGENKATVNCTDGPPAQMAVTSRRDGHVTMAVDANRGGYLMISESAYPGWKALMDGQAAKVLIVNSIFIGIEVPPGRHEIEFFYKPDWLEWAAGLTGIGLLMPLGLFLLQRKEIVKLRQSGDDRYGLKH